jgi:hypothetical protein
MNPTLFRNYNFLFFFLPLLTFGQTVQITSVEDSGSFLSCNRGDHKDFVILPRPIDAKLEGKRLRGPSVFDDDQRFVWGASVVKGEDDRYHMFFNTFESGPTFPKFTDGWVLGSKIGYAVSKYPDREFKFVKIILEGKSKEGSTTSWDSQMVTNPHIQKFNGKYYLYFVGAMDPINQENYFEDQPLTKRTRVQQSQKIGVIEFDSFEDLLGGNFKRPNGPLLAPRTRVKKDQVVNPSPKGTVPKPDNLIVTNPAVVYRPSDGKYLLYFKGNIYDPNWRGVHSVAISDSPTGPFSFSEDYVFDIRLEDGRIASAEDPFVWFHHKNDLFYAIIKDFSGKITESGPGLALLHSKDGIKWYKPPNPLFMQKTLTLKKGQKVKVNRLERPFLLTDSIGTPLVFYAACSVIDINPTKEGQSFNVHFPVSIE